MRTHFESLIVAGGGLTQDEELPEKVTQRMKTAIAAWKEGVAENIVVSGGHSFTLDKPSLESEASVMRRYGLANGVLDEAILFRR